MTTPVLAHCRMSAKITARSARSGIRELRVLPGALVALMGLDGAGAEMFVNLVTGAMLPDDGQVRVFGFDTAAITDGDEWLRTLDRFGILSDRAVLLDELTVAQNLAMTLTLWRSIRLPPTCVAVSKRWRRRWGWRRICSIARWLR